MLKKYITIERSHSTTLQRDYRCAGCWNPLAVGFDARGDWISCDTPGCSLPGVVSAKWVEGQLSESQARAESARQVLKDAFPWIAALTKSKLPTEKIISQLGF